MLCLALERGRVEAAEILASKGADCNEDEMQTIGVKYTRFFAERMAREKAERKAREKAESRARKEAERKAREEAETRAREEAEIRAREKAESRARKEAERKAWMEAERKAWLEAERKAREEAESRAWMEAERKAREEAESRAWEEAESRAWMEAETRAREEADRKAREEAESRAASSWNTGKATNTGQSKQPESRMERMLILQRQLGQAGIGEYKIKKVLGRGNYGIVFLVEVKVRDQIDELALKMIMNFHGLSTLSLTTQYENELNILNKEIKQVNLGIIQLIHEFTCAPTLEMIGCTDPSVRDLLCSTNRRTGVVTPKKTKFFVLEYHPITLEQKLAELASTISPREILKYSLQFCKALRFLYENKIVHRDIKPNNILISEDDELVISDFGESLKLDDCYCYAGELRGGNQQFTAPEVLNAILGQQRIIQFSGQFSWDAGCILYEIAMGEFPFVGYPVGFGDKYIHVPEPDFTFWDARLPTEYLNVIKQLLVNDPAQRMPITLACSILQTIIP